MACCSQTSNWVLNKVRNSLTPVFIKDCIFISELRSTLFRSVMHTNSNDIFKLDNMSPEKKKI